MPCLRKGKLILRTTSLLLQVLVLPTGPEGAAAGSVGACGEGAHGSGTPEDPLHCVWHNWTARRTASLSISGSDDQVSHSGAYLSASNAVQAHVIRGAYWTCSRMCSPSLSALTS